MISNLTYNRNFSLPRPPVIWFTYAVVFEMRELKGTSWIPSVMPWLEGQDQDGMWDEELEPKTFPIYQVGEQKGL